MKKTYKIINISETNILGEKLGKLLEKGDTVLLKGDLASGKTTITKAIAKGLGVKKVVNSPTYTIAKEYNLDGYKLIHMDLYRLNSIGYDLDLFEYFDSNNICIIEWPNNIEKLLPSEYLSINIKTINDDEREIVIESNSKHYEKLLGEL
ncbi:MAG: tRNA (adenosine(37)-N6)-threonylcarbamoyltransferase complex ATPase subunit type 1 TsaE [Anaeroplasmataceae bacterium]